MAAPPVMIRVGGSVDASLGRSFRTAVDMANQAEKSIQKAKANSTTAAERENARQLKAQERLVRASEALDRQRSAGLYRQYRQQEAAAERAAKAELRARQRAEEGARREIEKTVRAALRALEAEERARDRAQRRAGESFARRTSHRATRFLSGNSPLLPMAGRALRGIAQGLGVDFSLAGATSRVVDLQQQAQDISNVDYQPGAQGANGRRVDPAALVSQARDVGHTFGIDPQQVLGAAAAYEKLTGDLQGGRDALFGMAQLSRATGANLQDVASASANVANGLGDIPNKAEVVDTVMRTIAGQGKIGAVEISDMAVQMARVASAAADFAGDRAENIQKLGALVQISRAEGGSPSAAQAARALSGFSNTFRKAARVKAFQGEGIDVFTDSSRQKIKDPVELIKASLLKTNGDLVKMNKLFADVIGARTVSGLQKAYVEGGGGKGGLAKVDEMIARQMKAQMSKDEVKNSAALASQTTAAKAQRFQDDLDKIHEKTLASLVPAFEEATPNILKFAETLGNVATWMVTNPKTAIAGAISIAFARAGLESTLRAGIERVLLGPGNANASKLGSAVGKIGGIMTIASLAVTTLTVGMAVIDNWFTRQQQAQTEAVAKDLEGTNAANSVSGFLRKGDLEGAKAKAEEAVRLKQEALDRTNAQKPGWFGQAWDWELSNLGSRDLKGGVDAKNAALEKATAQQTRELVESKAVLADILKAIQAQRGGGGGDGRVEQ